MSEHGGTAWGPTPTDIWEEVRQTPPGAERAIAMALIRIGDQLEALNEKLDLIAPVAMVDEWERFETPDGPRSRKTGRQVPSRTFGVQGEVTTYRGG